MQYFRPGSQLRQLITMLSIVGEYPIRSLYLLGNERAYKALVHKLTTPETFRIPQSETEMTTRLLTVTGKGNSRSVRFYKGALPILDWLHPDAYRYYMDAFWEHKFPGNAAHRDRNHRVAEAVAMCMRSGIECRPYMLPILQNRTITQRIPDAPCFYLAKELKKLGEAEMNKTMFTRMVGTAYLGQRPYAEYRSRQLIRNFAHDTNDERAAATALQYGEYVDPSAYGGSGEPYYRANAGEAIAKAGYVGTVDEVAYRLATLVRNSAEHWCYIGSAEYGYIAVGVTYESGMWYCDIAVAAENTDNL